MIVEFLDFPIENVTLRADPAFENLLLNPGGIDAKANGVDLRSRFNQPLDCSAGSFQKRVLALRKLTGKLDFHVTNNMFKRTLNAREKIVP